MSDQPGNRPATPPGQQGDQPGNRPDVPPGQQPKPEPREDETESDRRADEGLD